MSDNSLPDVATILEQLRSEVRARRLAAGQSEPSAVEQELRRSLDEIELHRVVSAHWPLKGRTLAERMIVFVNKLVRRFLRWYINPIVEQQNAYNDTVARSLRLLADAYTELAEQVHAAQTNTAPPYNDMPTPPGNRSAASLQHFIEQQAEHEPPASFIELDLATQQPQLALHQQISAHWPLEGRTMPEQGAAFVHKLTRQYLRWLINPIVDQQNAANGAFATALRDLTRLDVEKRADVAALRANSAKQQQKSAAR